MRLHTVLVPAVAAGTVVDASLLHVVVDSALGIVVGAAVVAAYLAVLRWLDRTRHEESSGDGAARSPGRRSREP